MSWFIKQDTLFDKESKEVGIFLFNSTSRERTIIRNGEDLLDLIGELIIDYDRGKTPLKSVFDRLSKLVDRDINYEISWTMTRDGNLLNENDQPIFIFSHPQLMRSKIITYLPDAYSSSQQLLRNLSSTNRHETKKIYDRICAYYDKIHSEN